MSWTVDAEIGDLLEQAQSARDRFEAAGGLAKLEALDQERLEDALQDLGARAGCPDTETAMVARGGLRRTEALVSTRDAIASGWAPGSSPEGRRPWVVLHGGVGSGKTTAAVWALLKGTVRDGAPAPGARAFVPARHIAELNAAYSPDRARLDELAAVRWLVVDDLGSLDSGPDGSLALAVQRVLEDRYTRRRPTLITSNLPRCEPKRPVDLVRYVGGETSRLGDRLHEIAVHVTTRQRSLRRNS